MRAQGVPEEGIAFALIMTNKIRCMPPLDEIEVRAIASSATRYAPGTTDDGTRLILAPRSPHCEAKVWDKAITIDAFLQQEDEVHHSLIGELVYPSSITVIAGPRGMGKSMVTESMAVAASTGQTFRGSSISPVRVLFVDRDNPPHITRQRFRNWGVPCDASLSILTRNDAPSLMDTKAWQSFPVDDYDVVILDSYGSASEGVSEKEGQQTQRILATLKDLAHRGPAILVLDNTTKAATSYRGRGEKADAVDVLYEVRDVTGWTPGAGENWWEHLPEAGDHAWASRASRRKGQTRLRLAFIPSKFRLGIEPDPFCLEVNTGSTPWSLRDVTAEIEQAGEQAAYDQRHAERRKLEHAAMQLLGELQARSVDHPMRKKEAQEWLVANTGLTHRQAKHLLENGYNANVHPTEGKWRLEALPGQRGNAIAVLPVDPLGP